MTYKSITATARGGPEVLQVVENELRPPATGEVRIKVLTVPVVQDDVAVRLGKRPFLPKMPFVPGYGVLGTVDAVGPNVTAPAVGDRVIALTGYGGYAEYLYWDATRVARVPPDIDPVTGAVLILNYLVAYQILHRVAKVRPGDKVLIVGASGGVGTAFLQLGRLAGIQMYGLASTPKHPLLAAYGATPIDYRSQDFVAEIQRAEPDGIDFVFNGMGEEYFEPSLAVLGRGGVLVHYGGPESFIRFLLLVGKLLFYNVLPNRKSIKGYGTHRGAVASFQEDWATLFALLKANEIAPVIAATFPLLDAAKANTLLESGSVAGNIVLVAPEVAESKSAHSK
jgi:NADPH:quinone reductase-like Zn-dependent oxidoreductase